MILIEIFSLPGWLEKHGKMSELFICRRIKYINFLQGLKEELNKGCGVKVCKVHVLRKCAVLN